MKTQVAGHPAGVIYIIDLEHAGHTRDGIKVYSCLAGKVREALTLNGKKPGEFHHLLGWREILTVSAQLRPFFCSYQGKHSLDFKTVDTKDTTGEIMPYDQAEMTAWLFLMRIPGLQVAKRANQLFYLFQAFLCLSPLSHCRVFQGGFTVLLSYLCIIPKEFKSQVFKRSGVRGRGRDKIN